MARGLGSRTAMDVIDQQINQDKTPPKEYFYPTIVIDKENIDSQEVKEYGIWSNQVK